ncbi:MAG: SufD family Fe-S cluster assembly protein [Candidatus Moranbacteria bacterium]|nr:SufD family Fe-S cluster assembly protein [Candidatus Moranbacteria bacterium]MDD3964701.1 SufD family Fe-S cluster assembly protein [Candidatus Moranbacteria bacterium]
MKYLDISQDNRTTYVLKENESCIFFLFNRSGDITFNLSGIGAAAHIFCFFIGKNAEKHSLHITQNHRAPQTISHALIKSTASDTSVCEYEGTLFIEKNAVQSDASQESRAILLSPDATVSMKPTLEILTHDVKCSHKATSGPIDPESLFFAQSRGLSYAEAEQLLITGFWNDALERINKLDINEEEREIIKKYL